MSDLYEIHAVRSRIANAYIVVGERGIILVDTGFAGAANNILARVRELGKREQDVRLIVLTHAHLDHAGSAAELRRRTGAPIALHRADYAKAQAGKHKMPTGRGTVGVLLERGFNGARLQFRFEAFTPDVELEEGRSLADFGWNVRVLETPGHSLGSVSLVGEDGILFIGDAMINQIRVGMPLYGEDIPLAYESLRRIRAQHPRLLYSGHGKPFSGADVERYFEIKKLEPVQA